MSFQTKIKNRLNKVVDTKMYSPDEIVELGVILNIKFEPSLHKVYRLIKRGDLKAVNMSNEPTQPRWFVEGRDLRKFVEARYINSTK